MLNKIRLLSLIIFMGLSNMLFSQTKPSVSFDFTRYWKQVETYRKQNLPQSALALIDTIEQAAKAKNDVAQLAKAVCIRPEIWKVYREDVDDLTFAYLNDQLQQNQSPIKNLLYSLKAKSLMAYFADHAYEINNRKALISPDFKDLNTWSMAVFQEEILRAIRLSLENAKTLQQIPVVDFDVMIQKGDTISKHYLPTLYDLLVYQSIANLSNKPFAMEESFVPNQADCFAFPKDFAKLKPVTTDSLSFNFNILQLYRQIEAYHLQSSYPEALSFWYLERLNFVKTHTFDLSSDSLYVTYLKAAEHVFAARELFLYALANVYYEQQDFAEALKYAELCALTYPQTYSGKNAKSIIMQIKTKSYGLQVDGVVIPNAASLGLLWYRNIDTLYFRIYELNAEQQKAYIETQYEEQWKKGVLQGAFVKSWDMVLPDKGTFEENRIEFALPALKQGCYLIAADVTPDFRSASQIASTVVWSTHIGCVFQNKEGVMAGMVLDRQSGKSLSGVTLQVYTKDYDYQTSSYHYQLYKTLKTDKNGQFEIKGDKSIKDHLAIAYTYKGDRWFDQPYPNLYVREKINRPGVSNKEQRTYLFTDRSIYRPGQTVYFKGIQVETTGRQQQLSVNEKFQVSLSGVHTTPLSTMEVTTNDFGSFSGSFILPEEVLPGSFYLSTPHGSQYFYVEAYKRAQFEITTDELTGTYHLGDTIRLSGKAESYAMSAISHATVNYCIQRMPVYYGLYGKRISYPLHVSNHNSCNVASGSVFSDAEGRFSFLFPLTEASQSTSQKDLIYNYRIAISVTSLSGETQEKEFYVAAGRHPLLIQTDIRDFIKEKDTAALSIRTTNLQGKPISSQGYMAVFAIDPTKQAFYERNWAMDETLPYLSETEFRKLFPYFAYDSTDFPENQPKKLVKTQSFTITDTNAASFALLSDLSNGYYFYEMSVVSKDGKDTASQTGYFHVTSLKSRQPAFSSNPFTVANLQPTVLPGESILLHIGSADSKTLFYVNTQNSKGEKAYYVHKLSDEQKTIKIPMPQDETEGLLVEVFMVKNNHPYRFSEFIEVKKEKKTLDLTFTTFRSKLQPGQHETWTIHIQNTKDQYPASELMLSMYDASLDVFSINRWDFAPEPPRLFQHVYTDMRAFYNERHLFGRLPLPDYTFSLLKLDQLHWGENKNGGRFGRYPMTKSESVMDAPVVSLANNKTRMGSTEAVLEDVAIDQEEYTAQEEVEEKPADIRRNLQETAFFYPSLYSDDKGNVTIRFTVPDALTRWHVMGLAHTKDLAYGSIKKDVITQKDLMVFPYMPRFVRENDHLDIKVKIDNLSTDPLVGEVGIEWMDAATMEVVKGLSHTQSFSIASKQSTTVSFPLDVANNLTGLIYRVTAKTAKHSDGEEGLIPILSSRTLVTETIALTVDKGESKAFSLPESINPVSLTAANNMLTLELSTNPVWYAVQALPALNELPEDNSLDIFTKYYALTMAQHIAKTYPEIRQVVEQWKKLSPDAFTSTLEKNKELKSIVLEATPWMLDASSETTQKLALAALFDQNQANYKQENLIRKLANCQNRNGSLSWFSEGPDDLHVTLTILTGLATLYQSGIIQELPEELFRHGWMYVNAKMCEQYQRLPFEQKKRMNHPLSPHVIRYVYLHEMPAIKSYTHIETETCDSALTFYRKLLNTHWTSQNTYLQGMIALTASYAQDQALSKLILKSLKERALYTKDGGMYWRKEPAGYYWYQAPIETQAMMIRVFHTVAGDKTAVEKMKKWLLANKQTNRWETSQATSDAIFALLLDQPQALKSNRDVQIRIGNEEVIIPNTAEAGSGYFKKSWNTEEIKPDMNKIIIKNNGSSLVWGGLYLQYTEQLSKVKATKSPIGLKRQLFVEKINNQQQELQAIDSIHPVRIGDKVVVRIEIRIDRDMEYLHLKDLHPAGLEPEKQLSGYQWKNPLRYYQATSDVSTGFFFDRINKGTYVLEYSLRAAQSGRFSSGMCDIQSLYAPEFSAHTEGGMFLVKEK